MWETFPTICLCPTHRELQLKPRLILIFFTSWPRTHKDPRGTNSLCPWAASLSYLIQPLLRGPSWVRTNIHRPHPSAGPRIILLLLERTPRAPGTPLNIHTHTHAHTVPCPETLRPRVPVPGAPSFLAPVLCFQELSLCSLQEMTPEWLEPLPRNSDRHKCLGVYCHSPPLSCLKPVHGWRVQEDSQIPCLLRDTMRDDWSSRAPPRIRATSNFTNNHFIHPYPACLTPLLNSPRALP